MVYDCWEEIVDQYNMSNLCRSKHELPKSKRSKKSRHYESCLEKNLQIASPKGESVSLDKNYQALNVKINVLSNRSSFKTWRTCPLTDSFQVLVLYYFIFKAVTRCSFKTASAKLNKIGLYNTEDHPGSSQ